MSDAAEARDAAPAGRPTARPGHGALVLMPNALDASGSVDLAALSSLDELLPRGVLRRAASIAHWIVEDAKSARLFLKRVDAVVSLARPLQSISIVELPKPSKGGASRCASDGERAARRSASRAADGNRTGLASDARRDLATLLAPALDGHDLGLLSESGLPALADPGAALVAAAHDAGLEVVVLPGASSIALAVAASGLDGQRFAFVGYVPAANEARVAALRELEADSRRHARTQLLIETPYRNAALLDALLATLAPATRLSLQIGLATTSARSTTKTIAAWRRAKPALPDDVPVVFALLA